MNNLNKALISFDGKTLLEISQNVFKFLEACLEVIVSDLATMKKQLSSAEMEMLENYKLKSQLQHFFLQAKDKLEKMDESHVSAMVFQIVIVLT